MGENELVTVIVNENTLRIAFYIAMREHGINEDVKALGAIFDDFLKILNDPEKLAAINEAIDGIMSTESITAEHMN